MSSSGWPCTHTKGIDQEVDECAHFLRQVLACRVDRIDAKFDGPVLRQDFNQRARSYPSQLLTYGVFLVSDQNVTNDAEGQIGVFRGDPADLRSVLDLLGHRTVLNDAVRLAVSTKASDSLTLTATRISFDWLRDRP